MRGMLGNKNRSNAYTNTYANSNANAYNTTSGNNTNAYTNRRARIRSGIRNCRTVSSGVSGAEKEEVKAKSNANKKHKNKKVFGGCFFIPLLFIFNNSKKERKRDGGGQ
jgi:aminoglycoside phosphotransferase family enzyme